jgi:DNA-binding NarL/FixJ family response regulator
MNNGSVLLIHRHAGVRASLKKGLEQRGCEVIMGFNGASAENILKLEDIRAALVDLRTPECASLALVHRLQHIRPDLAVFGLADTPSKFEIEACRRAGLQGYFIAPFNPTALVNAIESIEMSSSEVEDRAAI